VCLANSCDDFTFITGECDTRISFVIAQFLLPHVCEVRSIDLTIDALHIHVDDPTEYFARFLNLGRGGNISVGSVDRATFMLIFTALESRELGEYTNSEITIAN
jgi:hypothetical protein